MSPAWSQVLNAIICKLHKLCFNFKILGGYEPTKNTILTGASADYNIHSIVYAYTHFAFVRTFLFTVGNTNKHFCELMIDNFVHITVRGIII